MAEIGSAERDLGGVQKRRLGEAFKLFNFPYPSCSWRRRCPPKNKILAMREKAGDRVPHSLIIRAALARETSELNTNRVRTHSHLPLVAAASA